MNLVPSNDNSHNVKFPAVNCKYNPSYCNYNIPNFDSNLREDTYTSTKTTPKNNKKKQMKTGVKIAIGIGIATAIALSADFICCNGKHIKSIYNRLFKSAKCKTKNSSPINKSALNSQTRSTPQVSQAVVPNSTLNSQTSSMTHISQAGAQPKKVFDGKSPVNIDDYTPPQQRAREFAIKETQIYYKGKKSITLYDKNRSPQCIYENAIQTKYLNFREASYPIDSRYKPDIKTIVESSGQNIKVKNQGGWYYRIPKQRTNGKSIDRISLNVYPDEELIKKLDTYFGTGRAKGYYKTPETIKDWASRHDPITIYLEEPINQSIIDDIVEISKHHIRSDKNVLVGNIVSAGVATDKSPTEEVLRELIAKARQHDETLAHLLETSTKSGFARNSLEGDYTLHTSAGQVAAVKALLDAMSEVAK